MGLYGAVRDSLPVHRQHALVGERYESECAHRDHPHVGLVDRAAVLHREERAHDAEARDVSARHQQVDEAVVEAAGGRREAVEAEVCLREGGDRREAVLHRHPAGGHRVGERAQ